MEFPSVNIGENTVSCSSRVVGGAPKPQEVRIDEGEVYSQGIVSTIGSLLCNGCDNRLVCPFGFPGEPLNGVPVPKNPLEPDCSDDRNLSDQIEEWLKNGNPGTHVTLPPRILESAQ